jgi:Carboxypeptidase regulatory-like domain/TonB dependent receptor-like, beta-barrel
MTTTGGRFWRRIISVAITACLGAWFVTLDLQAQAGAAILGAVSDSQGLPLPGVVMTLLNEESGLTRTSVSQVNGTYQFSGLPPGLYDLKATLEGFGESELKGQVLTVGLEVKHDFTMTIESLQESLTVTAKVPLIETTRSEVVGVVTQQQIENVPVPTRQTLNLALLLPGTNTDGSVPRRVSVSVGAGAAVSQNAFLVDGVTNQQSTSGDPRQDFPQGGIREFRVNVSQAPAEIGGTTGGVVAVVTKSGTNQFDGEVFEYFRDKSLNAMNVFEEQAHDTTGAPKPDFRQNQSGFTIGGPIVTNKAHFLVATDFTKTDQSIIVNTNRPQDYSAVEGAFPNDTFRRMFFGRGDIQLTSKETFFARWGWERDEITCQSCGGTNASTSGSLVQQRRNSLVLGHSWVLSNRALNEFRMQWAPFAFLNNPSEATSVWTEVGDFAPERFAEMTPVYIFPSLRYGTTSNKVQIETWWEFRDDFSFTTNKGGSHNWKMGVASVRAPNTEDLTGNPLGTWTFSTDQLFNPNDPATIAALTKPTQFSASGPPVVHDLKTNLFQTYLQDAWRLSGGLTVNLGVRYDLEYGSFNQDMDLSAFPKPLPYINPSTRGDHNNVQPRLGFAWDLNKSGESVLRASYGLYNGVVRNSSFGTELANLLQSNIIIRNPAYPDPYGGKDPLTFASTAPPNITIINDDIVNSFAQTANIGFSQQLARDLAIQVDGVYTRGSANLVSSNINSPDPTTGLRALPEWGRIVQVSPIGDTKYRALFVRVDKPFVNRLQYTVAYTLVKGDDNLTSINYFNRAADWGPSNTDRRQTLVVSGSVMVPWSLMVGGVWTLRSAMPFSAVAATDLNNDGSITDLVPGTTRNSGNRDLNLVAVNAYRAANGRAPIAIDQIDSNRYNSLDVRATRTFNLSGSKKVDIIAQVFNVLGYTNLLASGGVGSYVTNALSDSFAKILQAGNRQQAEFAVRFAW